MPMESVHVSATGRGTWIRVSRRISGQWWRIFLRLRGARIWVRWRHSMRCLWMMWTPNRWQCNPKSFLEHILTQSWLTTLDVQYRFDDKVKDDAHGVFTPEMLKLPPATWIATFVEGVTDKSTGLPLFSELVWFTYKVSGVMCSVSPYGFTLSWGIVWMTHYVIYYRGT